MDHFVQILCEKCNDSYLTEEENITGRYREDYLECWRCNTNTKVIPNHEIKDPKLFFDASDKELENANFHDRIGLAFQFWKTVETWIPEEEKINISKQICSKVLEF